MWICGKVSDGTMGLTTIVFVTGIATIIFTVASVDLGNAFGILAGELGIGAGSVMVLAVLSFVTAVTAIIVMIAHPSLWKRKTFH
jgi:hypothetical protein